MRGFALAVELERDINPTEGLGPAAHCFTLGQQSAREAPQQREFGGERRGKRGVGDRRIGNHVVEAIMAQIGLNVDTLQPRLRRQNIESFATDIDIE